MPYPPSPVRLARLTRGLRLHDVSQRTDINISKLSLIERGLTTPEPREVTRLSRVLRSTPADLFPARVERADET